MSDPTRSDRLAGIAAENPLSVRSSNALVLALLVAIPRATSAAEPRAA